MTKIYKEGYVALYGVRRAGCILLVMAAVAVFCLIARWRSKYMGPPATAKDKILRICFPQKHIRPENRISIGMTKTPRTIMCPTARNRPSGIRSGTENPSNGRTRETGK